MLPSTITNKALLVIWSTNKIKQLPALDNYLSLVRRKLYRRGGTIDMILFNIVVQAHTRKVLSLYTK